MKKDWFVMHALVGQELKVQKSINARMHQDGMDEYIDECLIPTEKVTEKKDGKTRTYTRRFFPGWVLVHMALYDEARGIDPYTKKKAVFDRTWQFLRETPGLIGSWLIQYPQPLKQSEVDAILSNKPAEAAEKPRPKVDFSVGETVKVNDGPFMGLTGSVSMVDPDKAKLKIEVNVFNRKVPVDAEYWQVEKVSVEELVAKPEA